MLGSGLGLGNILITIYGRGISTLAEAFRAGMPSLLRLLFLLAPIGVASAQAAEVGTAEEGGALGYSLAELHAALPNIPADELPSIVFRIPTIQSIMQQYRATHAVASEDAATHKADHIN